MTTIPIVSVPDSRREPMPPLLAVEFALIVCTKYPDDYFLRKKCAHFAIRPAVKRKNLTEALLNL